VPVKNHEIMKQGMFILTALAIYPITAFSKIITTVMPGTTKGFKVNSGDSRIGKHFKMKGVTLNVLDLKISSGDTGGDIAVFEQIGFTPKGGPPLHIHTYQDEFFYIIEGEYQFQVGEDKYQMKSGDTIFLPRNIQHAFIQLTEKGRVIVSYVPAGKIEDFFKTTDSWTSPPTSEEIARAFADHDMRVVGPPLKVDSTITN
jgi:quercetin dioxygenase-like cupin family protein